MTESRLDVGFVPVECPGSDGTGATHTSALLIERLSQYHDFTVYVASQQVADRSELPARDRVEYVLRDDLPMLPHPIRQTQSALGEQRDALESHDLVHSYSSAFIPVLASLEVPTLVTLNSYLPVCPKADFRYRGEANCSGPGPLKCAGCIPATALNRRQGFVSELKSAYLSVGRAPVVRNSVAKSDSITAFHALSPHLRDDYVDVGFDPEAITVVPHFYDERFFAPDAGASEPAENPTLLYVGALQDIKGVDVLLRALPLLEAAGHEIDVRIAGRGPYESTLRSLATELGVDERITWLGYVDHDELPGLYRDADLFVYPGVIDEPFGRVMLEALASHTPIVSSDVGSMAHIVGDAGVLFDPGEERQLAEAVDRLLDEYETHRNAIPEQLRQFSPETVVGNLLDIYVDTAGV